MVTLEDMNDIGKRLAIEETLNDLCEKSICKREAEPRVIIWAVYTPKHNGHKCEILTLVNKYNFIYRISKYLLNADYIPSPGL